MCTAGPNDNLWLTEATGKDVNGFDMLNDGNFALFSGNGGVVGPHGGQMKNWRFCSYGNFGDKKSPFSLAYQAVRGAIAFPST